MKNHLHSLAAAFLASALSFVSCSGRDDDPVPDPAPDVIHVTGVVLDETSLTMGIGDHCTLVVTVQPATATNKNVSWSSSDADVAGVYTDYYSSGNIYTLYANHPGSATITATTGDGRYTATCVVTVGFLADDESDVYVVGARTYDDTDNYPCATLWRNRGKSVRLAASPDLHGSDASSVFVSAAGDVYVAGSIGGYSSEISVPVLWKNSEPPVRLLGAGEGGYAHSVFVSDAGGVYVAGEYAWNDGGDCTQGAWLWKNGAVTRLPHGAAANSVFVSGNDGYVAGFGNVDWSGSWLEPLNWFDCRAIVWKNNELIFYCEDIVGVGPFGMVTESAANSVFVSSAGDVYVAGDTRSSIPASETEEGWSYHIMPMTTVWKNGEADHYALGADQYLSVGYSVYVSGNDVYVAGVEQTDVDTSREGLSFGQTAALWKNGVLLHLDDMYGTKYFPSEARSVFVSAAGDVYVAGDMPSSEAGWRTGLWKNGVGIPVSTSGHVNSVFVK
jgi:hypothetical protein